MTNHDIWSAFAGVGESTVSLAPFAIYVILAVVIIFGGLIVAREWQKRVHYKTIGIPVDPVRIVWEKRYGGLEGYLSKVELLTDERFEALALQANVKVNAEILKQLRNENRLHIYYLNLTDEGDTDESFNDIYICSPLELENCGFYDQRGKRYIYSLWNRIRRRNLYFFETSEQHTISNPDEDKEDWWFVNPKASGKTESYKGYKGNKSFEEMMHVINTQFLEGGRKLATELSFTKHLAEALTQNQEYKAKAELFEKLHGKKVSELIGKHIKVERWKMEKTRHPYVVLTKEQIDRDTGVNAVWIALSAVIGGLLSWQLPSFIPQVTTDSATMLGIIVSAVSMMLLFKIMSDKQKNQRLDEADSVEL